MRISQLCGVIWLGLCIVQAGCVEKVPRGEASSGGGSGGYQAPASPASSPEANNGRIVPPAPSGAGPAAGAGGEAGPKSSPELAKRVSDLETRLKNSPGDAKTKKELAAAYYQQGMAVMSDGSLPPRMKYRPALKLFNRALALDPQNGGAARNKATIEEIYKQMGMPIPQ